MSDGSSMGDETLRPDADLLRRAMDPPIVVGAGELTRVLRDARDPWVLVTQAEPLALLPAELIERASAVRKVVSLGAAELEALTAGLPTTTGLVVGFGGGMAIDAAKWCAWRRGLPLILAPGIVSVDAVVTNTVAVRAEGGIQYRGFVVADSIVVDTGLVRRAPARLNRAGVGDLLSIHTGLRDWQLGALAGTIAFDPAIAAEAAAVLDRVEALGPEIGAVSEAGLEGVLRAFAEVNALCLRVGHAGPEEGSEHFFAYRLEQVTGRSFIHGEVIGLATVLMATLQENDPARPRRILEACCVDWRPAALGVDREAVRGALVGLAGFVRDQALPHSVIDEADLSPATVDALLDGVLGADAATG